MRRDVFRRHDEGELHAGVFGVETRGELVFGFRQVERQAVRFGESGDHEDEEADELRHDEPQIVLRLDDVDEAKRPGVDHHAHDRQPHEHLVGDHLRRRPERA